MPDDADISRQLDWVRGRLTAAAHRSSRSPADITLIAVSKTFGPDAVRAASEHGQRVFGENRIQEATEKIAALEDLALEWHLVGHLQSNKAKKAAAAFSVIHSIDSRELLAKLDTACTELDRTPRVLLQVDLAHEPTKHGADEHALRDLAHAALDSRSVVLAGLMTVPPVPGTPEDSRPWFRRLREVRDQLVAAGVPENRLGELSMGMSDDFEVAVEEGATMVRVGSLIFGRRPAAPAPQL